MAEHHADSENFCSEEIMANEGCQELLNELTDTTCDMHWAIVSLMEQLEAIDWYTQPVDACRDPLLRSILAHSRDKEKEHAAKLLDWIRRKDAKFKAEMADYVFTDKPVAHH